MSRRRSTVLTGEQARGAWPIGARQCGIAPGPLPFRSSDAFSAPAQPITVGSRTARRMPDPIRRHESAFLRDQDQRPTVRRVPGLHQYLHLCPHRHKPVNFSSRAQLFRPPAASGVHPSHCRSSTDQDIPTSRPGAPCGAPLAHDPLHHHRPGPALLALQHKILRLLRPGGPKRPAQQYFTELILLAGLVMICWPRVQAVGTTRQLAAAVGRHLAVHEGTDSRPYRSTGAPVDAFACAGLLQVTDRILAAGDLREALSALAPEENRTGSGIPPTRHLIWDKNFKRHRSACSERFQLAADTVVPTFRRTGKGGLRLPSTGVGLRPEHIPAFLPQALAEHHLNFLSAIAPKMRRRSAAAFLVRRARGGSLDEAAQFLGINPQGKRNGYTQLLNRHLRTRGTARDFEQALTPSPPNSSPALSSITSTDAKPSPLGPWNPRTGSTSSLNSRSSQAIENPSATTADAWPSAPTSGPAPPKASPTSPPAHRTSHPIQCYTVSGRGSGTTSSTGSAKPTTSPTTAPSSCCSKTTPSTWPRRSTDAEPERDGQGQDRAVRNDKYRLKASRLSGVKRHSSRADRSSGSVSQSCQATSSGSGTTASGTTASCTPSQ